MIDFIIGGIVVLSVFVMGMELNTIREILKARVQRLKDD